MMARHFLLAAAAFGFIGVGMGAFGAHGLKPLLSEYQLEVYKTAVTYQMWHALLLGLIACLPEHKLLGRHHWHRVVFRQSVSACIVRPSLAGHDHATRWPELSAGLGLVGSGGLSIH
jgi:Protein of unknown function (DUF423)